MERERCFGVFFISSYFIVIWLVILILVCRFDCLGEGMWEPWFGVGGSFSALVEWQQAAISASRPHLTKVILGVWPAALTRPWERSWLRLGDRWGPVRWLLIFSSVDSARSVQWGALAWLELAVAELQLGLRPALAVLLLEVRYLRSRWVPHHPKEWKPSLRVRKRARRPRNQVRKRELRLPLPRAKQGIGLLSLDRGHRQTFEVEELVVSPLQRIGVRERERTRTNTVRRRKEGKEVRRGLVINKERIRRRNQRREENLIEVVPNTNVSIAPTRTHTVVSITRERKASGTNTTRPFSRSNGEKGGESTRGRRGRYRGVELSRRRNFHGRGRGVVDASSCRRMYHGMPLWKFFAWARLRRGLVCSAGEGGEIQYRGRSTRWRSFPWSRGCRSRGAGIVGRGANVDTPLSGFPMLSSWRRGLYPCDKDQAVEEVNLRHQLLEQSGKTESNRSHQERQTWRRKSKRAKGSKARGSECIGSISSCGVRGRGPGWSRDDRRGEAGCWSCGPCIPESIATRCKGEDVGWRCHPRKRSGRRGFDWWTTSRELKLCSGRDEAGGRNRFGSEESYTFGLDTRGGSKRRYFEELEAEEEGLWNYISAAGTSREAGGATKEEEERRKEGQEDRQEVAGSAWRKEKEREEGKKEEPAESQERPRRSVKRWKLWGGVKLLLREFRGWIEGVGQRDFVRASSEAKGFGITRVSPGDASSIGPGAVGQRSLDGNRKRRSGIWHKDYHLLCTSYPPLLCSRKSLAARTVCLGPSNRLAPCGEVGGNRGCASIQIRGCPHGPQRGVMGYGEPTGIVPVGKYPECQYSHDVTSPTTQEAGLEESGIQPRKMEWQGPRRLALSRGEGEQGRRKRKRKGEERRTQRKGAVGQQSREQPVEGEPVEGSGEGGSSKEVRSTEEAEEKMGAGGKSRASRRDDSRKGLWFLTKLLPWCTSLASAGGALAWLVFNGPRLEDEDGITRALRWVVGGNEGCHLAMHRGRGNRHRSLLPFPLGGFTHVCSLAGQEDLDAFTERCRDQGFATEVWTALCLVAVNGIAGHGRKWISKEPTVGQKRATAAMEAGVKRMLCNDVEVCRSYSEVEKEMSARFLSYTGEEVPKMQTLSVLQVLPALPPESHGGSIDARDFVSPSTRQFLENPSDSLLEEVPQDQRLLHARVHIQKGDEMSLCKLLVNRNICGWVPESEVLTVQGVKVLNGLFGVGKGKFIDESKEKEILRVIMNLKPTNRIMKHAEGSVAELPSITQYLSLVLEGDESAVLFQSDMSSAFYLFKIPPQWMRFLCFGISFSRETLGIGSGREKLYLACNVIPMGWASAVSIMQEIADRLTALAKLPVESKVRRLSPLPVWMVQVLGLVREQDRAWYHVYLDNFCAMGKTTTGTSEQGFLLHKSLEEAWNTSGVLSSSSKRVSGALVGQELGGHFDGNQGVLGPSGERLIRLIQSSLMVIGTPRLKKKWIQVVAGRWVHVMSFRRPGMIMLDKTWQFIGAGRSGIALEQDVRGELFQCCITSLMLHTNLRSAISETTTASDASSTGGAVGASRELSVSGSEFCDMDTRFSSLVVKAPILVISLFNGVGCAFRCYDLIGVQPLVGFSFEID